MKVLSTRRKGAAVYRRIEDGGLRYTTVEVPLEILTALNLARVEKRLEAWERGQARRQRTAEAAQRVLGGEKIAAVAHDLEVSHQSLYALRARVAPKKTSP